MFTRAKRTSNRRRIATDLTAAIARHFQERQQRLTDEQRQKVNLEPLASLAAWARHFLPVHFSKPPSEMHSWLFARADEAATRRGLRVNLIGPRGGAKSTIGSLAFPLRAAVEGTERLIWLVSETKDQAIENLRNIKSELLDNVVLARAYPGACGRGSVWQEKRIRLRNGVTIEAYGKGQKIRGRKAGAARPSLILADDIQGDAVMSSARQRDNDWTWFDGSLLKAGNKSTNVFNLATALHRDAIAIRLNRTPGWTSQTFPAIVVWPKSMKRWGRWAEIFHDLEDPEHDAKAEAYYRANEKLLLEGARVLWPEEEDLLTLMKQWTVNRSTFEREKQGRPVNPEECEWPEDYFDDDGLWFSEWPETFDVRVMTLDPSKGKDAKRSDYSAYCMLQLTRGVLYVDMNLARRPTPKMVSDGVDLFVAFRPQAFAVESNQYQELLAGVFVEEFRKRGIAHPPIAQISNTINKQVRIRSLGPWLAQRRLKFKRASEGSALTIGQLRDFPDKDTHDDGPDAIEMAIRIADELLHGRHGTERHSGVISQ